MKMMAWQSIVQREHLSKEFVNWLMAAKTKWRILLFHQNHQQLHFSQYQAFLTNSDYSPLLLLNSRKLMLHKHNLGNLQSRRSCFKRTKRLPSNSKKPTRNENVRCFPEKQTAGLRDTTSQPNDSFKDESDTSRSNLESNPLKSYNVLEF